MMVSNSTCCQDPAGGGSCGLARLLTMTETKVEDSEGQTELKSCEGGVVANSKAVTAAISPAPALHPTISPTPTLHSTNPFTVPKGEKSDCAVSLPSAKPKIWSLADTAACKTPPPTGGVGGAPGSGWLAGGTTFPLPPTIPPTQQQYPHSARFTHLIDGVGTDTPPQTPPNVKGQQGQQGQGAGLLGTGAFLGGSSSGSYVGGSMSVGLSSCSRGSTAPLPAPGVGSASVGDTSLHQRYQGGGSHAPNHNNTATSLPNTAFTPVYKNAQQGGQQVPQQTSQMANQQQMPCQQTQQVQGGPVTAGPYVS
ncbi:Homeobox protein caupolican-like [Homarus americanus]|uniref:Homeobox protein caupolican-like n=1 Tax=Homarus americanus TaxID=6706 RepID=A0A8J5JUE0_HOMAM|nr:Homeobox protein caupolican-like [Homarus americanus]